MTLVLPRARTPRIGPGAGSVAIELYAPPPTGGRWDRSTWDGGTWSTPGWQRIDCEVVEAHYRYGVTDEAGVLSAPDSGPCDLETFDPDRTLDPANPSSPFFTSVGPGTPIRLRKIGATELDAWTGFIDEASYDVVSGRGRIRCVDGIAYLAQADVPAGTALPNTLRARVRAIVSAVGLSSIVPVAPEVRTLTFLAESFENVALPGWTPVTVGAGSGSIVDPLATAGSRVLSVVGATGTGYYRWNLAGPIVAGGVYTLRGAIARPAGTAAGTLQLRGRDSTGAFVGPVTTLTPTGAADGTFEYASGTYTAPADGSIASLEVRCMSSTLVADKPRFDDVTLSGPDAAYDLGPDVAVAPYNGEEQTAWAAILDAAQDALTYVWLGPGGYLRFTSWGAFPDADVSLGCGPADEGPWVQTIETVGYTAAASGIRNQVRAWSAASVNTATIADDGSVAKYGGRLFAADRIVPTFSTWAGRILADRAGAGLTVDLGTVRPLSELELDRLLGIGVAGPSIVRVFDDTHPPVIDQDVAVIGAGVRVTAVGWSFEFATTIPRVEWESTEPPPPIIPPEPPVGTWHTETRTYIATSDALLALTSGGAKYGAGAADTLPVGVWSGWTYRSLVQLPSIPWTKVRAVKTATLQLNTTSQVRVGFGSGPTIEVRRITGSWSAGSSSSPGSGNAVVYPGPSTTSTGAVRANVTKSENAGVSIRIDAIARAWAPSSVAGGSASAQRGVALYGGSGSSSDTTEFWPVEKGGSNRPQLVLELEVFD